ncbi:ATP-binding protein [Candidatus Dependentiae bacterium]|nr:MAG: ATP-binding protein [Candidatus Dependentiae bacterium]
MTKPHEGGDTQGGAPPCVHDLTPRDCKAINLLIERQIAQLNDNPREAELWRTMQRRFNRDVSAKPESMAPALCEFVGAARAVNYGEIDRVGLILVKKLFEHGDLEGSRSLSRTLNQPFEKPDLVPRKKGGRGDPYVAAHSGPQANQSSQKPGATGPSGPSGTGGAIPPGNRPAPVTSYTDNPNIKWYDPTDLADEMVLDECSGPALTRLIEELKFRSVLLGAGVDAPTRVFFHGPPGTGKTLAARYIGGAINKPVAAAKIGSMMSMYLSATTTNLIKVLDDAAREDAIIFLDEIETVAADRAAGLDTHEEYKRTTGALLQALDQLPPHIIVVAATNFPDKIDKALRSRLTFEVAFNYPDKHARYQQIVRHLKVHADPESITKILTATEGKSGRFIRAVAMAANRAAIMSAPKVDGVPDIKQAKITIDHVTPALNQALDAEKNSAKTEAEMKKR